MSGRKKTPRASRHKLREGVLAANVEQRLLRRVAAAQAEHPDDWELGLAWYATEGARLEGMALALGVPAGILKAAAAVLSPGNSWSVLLERLSGFVHEVNNHSQGEDWPSFPTYGSNIGKAMRLLKGSGVPAEEVRGRKVWPFYAALAGDRSAVVLDRHSSRHALGREVLGVVEHRAAVEGFRRAAAVLGLAPRDLQAALWTADVGPGGDVGGVRVKTGARGLESA